MLGLAELLDGYHRAMNNLFEWYGSFTAHRPAVPLAFGIVLLGGLCFGLFNIEKESNLENLWVEQNSRVVEEKQFFDERYGGIPRLEAVTITPRNGKDFSLIHAMDALKSAVAPLYENLTMESSINGKAYKFRENDFCERPRVPDLIKSGNNPLIDGNFLSWGYSRYANCSLKNKGIPAEIGLPDGWGIDWLPCLKLSPLDCFKEGGDFDYPPALKLLEQPVTPAGVSIAQLVLLPDDTCVQELQSTYTSLFAGLADNNTISQLVQGVTGLSQLFFTWGYGWRKSYAGMTNEQVLDHINSALRFGKSADPNPANPQILSCVLNKLPCCMTYFGAHSPTLTSLGAVSFNSSGDITEIGGIRWAGNHYHHNHPVWKFDMNELLATTVELDQREKLTKQWESLMIHQLDPLRQHAETSSFADKNTYGDLQLEFNMWRSSEDIINDANKTPIWQICLSGVLVSVYSFLAFVNFRDPVHSHTWLALTGMAVVSLAVVAGFGFSAAVGIKLTPLAGSVVPFLTLGLGIDDVFVLVNVLRNYLKDPFLKRDYASKVPEVEMRMTAALAGPSVVLTTFSVLASFFISSLSPMPIVRWFCWQMGITATIHTLGMLLIFIPTMSIDARRVRANICDPYLWLFCGFQKKKDDHGSLPAKDTMLPGEDRDYVSGTSLLSKAVAKYYVPLFESNVFKATVVAVFAALLAVTTYLGFAKVEHGLLLSDITLKGSYQNTFAVVTEGRFLSYQISYVTRDIDFAKNQEKLLNIYQTFQRDLSFWTPPQPKVLEASVLGNLMVYVANSRPDIKPIYVNVSGTTLFTIPEDVFDQTQRQWSSTPLGVFSLTDYYCEDRTTKQQIDCLSSNFNLTIGSTKSSIFTEHLGAETEPNLQMIKRTRKISDSLNAEAGEKIGFFFGYPFLFFEQYLHSNNDLYMVVGFALLGVFLAVLIFQFSIVISVLIVVVLLMVDLEVYGFIYIIGAKLNSLSLVNLGIVIGMAAELTYLARSFLMVEGSRNYRVGKALEWTLEPLLHGFGTQVVATLPLIFIKYHAFRLYYFAMFTVMGVLSFLNGFVLLPVLLSWFGPPALPSRISSSEGGRKFSPAAAKANDESSVIVPPSSAETEMATNGHSQS